MADKKPSADAGGLSNCRSEKCTTKEEKMGFCKEHFQWFKAGLLTKAGQRPPDFDKKYQAYVAKHGKKAA